jgi:hypothetical protein
VGDRTYLIRFGVMGQVGRFVALPECAEAFERGNVVVIRSHRGTELGEVLVRHDPRAPRESGSELDSTLRAAADSSSALASPYPHILRRAAPEDLASSERAQQSRPSRFTLCKRVLEEGNWPWDLIDVEPLLDDRTLVLHYLGPHHLDIASLRARLRVVCDLDVVLEPAGTDVDSVPHEDDQHGEGSRQTCGSCDCRAEGGCESRSVPAGGQDGLIASSGTDGSTPEAHAGCASCGIGQLLAARNRQRRGDRRLY